METGAAFDFFTAEDILTVADISNKEIETLKKENKCNVEKFLNRRQANEN